MIRLLFGPTALVGTLLLVACSPTRDEGPPADSDAVRVLDAEGLLAHVQPTATHPATLINFWATW